MPAARLRLVLAATLFLLWIGWLGYLALTAARPVIVSRPQLLVSALDVRAAVAAADDGSPLPAVTVLEVLYPPGKQPQHLSVTNLGQCQGWEGPGEYLLPLIPSGDGTTYQ